MVYIVKFCLKNNNCKVCIKASICVFKLHLGFCFLFVGFVLFHFKILFYYYTLDVYILM